MPNQYDSAFTGQHNDDYDSRITTNTTNIATNTANIANKVAKTGDTMSGNLYITRAANPCLVLKNTNIDTTSSTLAAAEYNSVYFEDANGKYNAYVQASQNTDGSTQLSICARTRKEDDSGNVNSYFTLKANRNNTVSVSLGSPAAWRNALGTVLKGTSAPSSLADGVIYCQYS